MATVLDIETNTTTSYKRKGNPFDPEAKIVAAAVKRGSLFETAPGNGY